MKGDYMEMADSITLTMNTEPIVTIDDLTFGETTLKHAPKGPLVRKILEKSNGQRQSTMFS